MKKIIVVGLGNVGFTYINTSVARGLEAEWVLVDKNVQIAEAHAHDFEDMVSLMPRNGSTFRPGTLLEDSKDADVVVITASIPADKTFSDRMALAGANAKLMQSFAKDLDAAGFKGIVVVAANPCDVMAAAVHYGSKIPANRVISAGTNLETGRLKKMLAAKFKTSPDAIRASVLGEHGATAMIAWSTVKVGETTLEGLVESGKITKEDYEEVLKQVIAEAFYIWSHKGNTQFGIATSLFEITKAILDNRRTVMNLGVKIPEGYKHAGIYVSIPVIIGENGYEYLPFKPSLTKEEWIKFEASTEAVAKVHTDILKSIGVDIKFE
ncbi:lactate/malate family dehydrogenase [Mycoplasmopsis bovis]|uniref:lactate/malate family dehydrogenase n=1 Tax=Mycoplasmopsis bovis TaxID=28903 RepID=UPI0007A03C74|nr:L-lactate dehydrogenase [Mycoplasmopsis bovis]AMW26407.1 L-lactate dehydrogenase (L-LDH) [Mycoplasmopsis bovis]TQF59672.1 L-lactate dehydrogenase [Mycoplasmopsis bovis]